MQDDTFATLVPNAASTGSEVGARGKLAVH